MPYSPVTLDDSFGRTEPGRPRVPQGYYRARIEAIRPTPETYDRTPGYNVDFRIAEGPTTNPGAGVGRNIGRYNSMGGKEGSQFGMGATLGAAGQGEVAKALLDRYKGKALDYATFVQVGKFLESKLRGKDVVLTIVDEMSDRGRPFSSVLEVQSISQWEVLKGTPLIGAPSAPNGSAPAAAPSNTVSMAEAVAGMFTEDENA